MAGRESIEKVLAQVTSQAEEAATLALQARDQMARIAAGIVSLEEADPRVVRAVASDFAEHLQRWRDLQKFRAHLRGLLL